MRKANTRRVAGGIAHSPLHGLWGLEPLLGQVARTVSLTGLGRRRISLGEGVLGLRGLDNLVGVAAVQLHELGEIELGLLEDLDLLDEDVLEREDLGALLGDLLGNVLGDANML